MTPVSVNENDSRWPRSAGLLLHPTSLPGPYGCGDIGPAAHRFAEFLSAAGQSWWQMLPVGPTGAGVSPYASTSSFAGNPLLISPELLFRDGLLARSDLQPLRARRADRVDFIAARRHRGALLRQAFERFEARRGRRDREAFDEYRRRNARWLDDAALFGALRRAARGASWSRWDEPIRLRNRDALQQARRALAQDVRFEQFLQYQFDRQWAALRRRCAKLGVGLIGDLPFYTAYDSADVWANQACFHLDAQGRMREVAGVPPDYFSRDGQVWNNPLFRWDVLHKRDYDWWIDRLAGVFRRFDTLRLDHFIGFHRSWAVRAGARTARRGRWLAGPGDDFFRAAFAALSGAGVWPVHRWDACATPAARIIAEDLGLVVDAVRDLRDRWGFPGMRVLQFAFLGDKGESEHLPHNHPRHCVVYTGTHDNDTAVGWFNERPGRQSARTAEQIRTERRRVLEYTGADPREIHWAMIRLAMGSVGAVAIAPVQDVLGLGSEARMNRPGQSADAWRWRLAPGLLGQDHADRLRSLTQAFGRDPRRRRL